MMRGKPDMGGHRKHEIAAIIILVSGVIAYASFRSESRLRADMPVEFFDPARVPEQRRNTEVLIARAYWDCAMKLIQWKYGYAHRLPEQPPAEFSIAAMRAGRVVNDAAEREFYWRRLRSVWGNSAAWEKKYEWSTIALTDSLRSAGQWLDIHMRRIVRYS